MKSKLLYLLTYVGMWLLAVLPFPVLYALSDFIYFWLYHVIDQITISDTIVFSHVGYFPLKCTLSELQHLGYKVVLHEHPQLLHEVVVSGERPPFFLEWTSLSPLPKPLYSFGGFLHAGKIYVVAGDETLIRMVTDKHRRSTSLLSFTMTACMRWEEL